MPDDNKQPNWQPISQLPTLSAMTKGILENTENQYHTFLEIVDKPHVLDDATVHRAQRLYRTQLETVDLYDQQAERWLQDQLTPQQRQAVETMLAQTSRIRDLSQKILELLADIEKGTIDRIMAKSDLEVGLEFLLRNQRKKE